MKHHFISITRYSIINKAHKAAQEFIKDYQKIVIDDKNLIHLKATIKREINRINEENPRCKDIVVQFWQYEENLQHIVIDGNFIMRITEINSFHIDEQINPTS